MYGQFSKMVIIKGLNKFHYDNWEVDHKQLHVGMKSKEWVLIDCMDWYFF